MSHQPQTSEPQHTKRRFITHNLLMASTSLTKSSKESEDAYLKRVTHLHLQSKHICQISALEACTNLKVTNYS